MIPVGAAVQISNITDIKLSDINRVRDTMVPYVSSVKITDFQFNDMNRIDHRVRYFAIHLDMQSLLCRPDSLL